MYALIQVDGLDVDVAAPVAQLMIPTSVDQIDEFEATLMNLYELKVT